MQDGLPDSGKPEVPGFDDTSVNWADGNFDNPFAMQGVEAIRLALDARHGDRRIEVLAQRVKILGPVVVQHQAPRIRVSLRLETQKVAHLALIPVGRRDSRRHRRETGVALVDGRLDRHPAAGPWSEDVDQPERAGLLAFVQPDHRRQARVEAVDNGVAGDRQPGGRNLDPCLTGHLPWQTQPAHQGRQIG